MSDTIHWQSKPGFLLGASFLILKDLELINQITRKLDEVKLAETG